MKMKKLILVDDQTGEEIPVRKCPNCGQRNKALAEKCAFCGGARVVNPMADEKPWTALKLNIWLNRISAKLTDTEVAIGRALIIELACIEQAANELVSLETGRDVPPKDGQGSLFR